MSTAATKAPVAQETIAMACYEANRAFCEAIGDHSFKPWGKAEQWQRDTVLDGVRFHITHREATPEMSHDNWIQKKQADGWTYGPIKDAIAKTHPCMVPYAKLPKVQQAKDTIFCAIVEAYRERAV